jgi:hypothetical protein
MSFSTRYTGPVLVTLFSLAVTVSAQTTTKQTAKAPRGSISGRVTIKDKGAAGMPVGVRKSQVYSYEAFVRTTTDQDGYYRIGDLAAGSYDVTPSAPAFVAPVNQKTKTVIIGEDENVEDINFTLVRGGVITGKVTDADGRALILQQVSLFRNEAYQGQPRVPRPLYPMHTVTTDDRGIYRMYGLQAGSYKVAAGRGDDGVVGPVVRSAYRRVFHPDATEPDKAVVIELREGGEATNVDITLGRPMQTFSMSGQVIDGEKGVPVPNFRIGLQRSAGPRFEMIPSQVMSNALGEFVVDGLIPGKYGFYLFQVANQNPFPDMRLESFTVDLVDQDLTGVTVKLIKGSSLAGVIVLETEDKSAIQRLQKMRIQAYVNPQGGESFGQSSSSPIGPDGSFRLGGLANGTANLYLSSTMGALETRPFVISRLERDGVVQPPRGIEIKEGEHISGLRIVVTYGSAKIRGVVKIENGSLPPEAHISVNVFRPGENFSSFPSTQVDARGHFVIESLPAGVYQIRVSVVRAGPLPSRSVTQDVSVQDGAVTDVVVRVDLGQTP